MSSYLDERDVFVDPVSHIAVDPNNNVGHVFYNGHMYYFSNLTNLQTFKEDPQLWISTAHASMSSSSITPVADE
ncbi:MAG: hypothetical protein JWQ02_247 [Capsulimonas sp.]|jgi:YHS domain-containing protein|nr:hypothetical protein [Capsulimonas sp.]